MEELHPEERNKMQMEREKFLKGTQLFAQKKYTQALQSFHQIDFNALYNYDRALLNHYIAMCHSHLQDFRKSAMHFEYAIEQNPHDALLHMHYGITNYFYHEEREELRNERLKKAAELIEKALLHENDNAETWYYHGIVHEKLGDTQKAQRSFRKALHHDKNHINKQGSRLFEKVKRSRSIST